MKLASRDGHFLELRILGYEFPQLETEEYDSNWLIIAGNVTHSRGSWQFTQPCLLTYEAERLASWMDALAEANLLSTTCGFIEPNLEFRALFNTKRPVLQVYFNLEARPLWASSACAGKEDIWVEFPIEELDLRTATRQWRTELTAYPQRASR
jgi:hypothetical protein